MKSAFEISDMKRAWQEVYRERTCPGHKVLFSEEYAAEVAEHNKRCPACEALTREELDSWKELGESLRTVVRKPENPEPAVGQVRALKAVLGGWDEEHRYINPPMVLVLEVFQDVHGVRVAQIFDAPELALSDDVDLEDYLGHAESWNSYAMRAEDLGECWGRVSKETVQRVRSLAEQGVEAEQPEEDSVIYFFRQLELEVGARMAMQALPDLVERHEQSLFPGWMNDPAEVRGKVLKFAPRAEVPETGDSLAMLAGMRFPEEMRNLAASDPGTTIQYNVLTLGESDFQSGRVGLARLDEQDLDGETIHVEGRLDQSIEDGMLLAWWKVDERFVEGDVEIDARGVYFEADFSDRSEQELREGELILLLLRRDDGRTH